VQKVKFRRFSQSGIRHQAQAARIPHRSGGLSKHPTGGIGYARENFEGTGQIDLIQSLEQQRTDLEVDIVRDHDAEGSSGYSDQKAMSAALFLDNQSPISENST
jgi:hypothetical protein